MSEPVRIRGPEQIVSAVPALLGFYPHNDLVAIWSDTESHRVLCLVRVDLETAEADMSRTLLDVTARLGPSQLITIVYPVSLTQWVDSRQEQVIKAALETVQEAGVTITDSLLVADRRWRSLTCTDPVCCPPEGQLIPDGTPELEAVRVAHGLPAVAGSRDAVVARYQLRPTLPLHVLEAAQQAADGPLAVRRDRASRMLSGELLEAENAAQLMWLMQDVHVRDWVLADLSHQLNAARVDTLVKLALAAPDDLRPRLAGAAAAALTMTGDNPVAFWAVIDHAGDDSLARLAAEAVRACIPPQEIRTLFAQAGHKLSEKITEEHVA